MREILFRGKRTDNGEWVYWDVFGRIVCDDGKTFNFVMFEGLQYWYIKDVIPLLIPETVGQYTGRTDKNGVKIFDGDIVFGENYLFPCYDARKITVYWHDDYSGFRMNIFNASDIAVVGNIHDNPELLEVKR